MESVRSDTASFEETGLSSRYYDDRDQIILQRCRPECLEGRVGVTILIGIDTDLITSRRR